MSENLNNWSKHFVPECFFDTVLLKRMLKTDEKVLHKRGCNNVVNELRRGSLKDKFAVALVDKDKKELDFLTECELLREADGFLLWKHQQKHQYIIQLHPPLENWIKEVLHASQLSIEALGFSEDPRLLKREIKFDIDSEGSSRLKRLVGAIVNSNVARVQVLQRVLIYLRTKNYQVDIKELKNV